jgi:hypothetical protein
MVDSLELVPTLFDVGQQPEIAMAAYKSGVVIVREMHEISARFQRILDICGHYQHAVLSPILSYIGLVGHGTATF